METIIIRVESGIVTKQSEFYEFLREMETVKEKVGDAELVFRGYRTGIDPWDGKEVTELIVETNYHAIMDLTEEVVKRFNRTKRFIKGK